VPSSSTSPGPGVVALYTRPPETPESCPAAITEGTLVRHAASGMGYRDPLGVVRAVIWPHGYSAREEGGRLAVVDESGNVVAHEGDHVTIGGGEVDEKGTWLGCGGVAVLTP
jgi:hypothetical protein